MGRISQGAAFKTTKRSSGKHREYQWWDACCFQDKKNKQERVTIPIFSAFLYTKKSSDTIFHSIPCRSSLSTQLHSGYLNSSEFQTLSVYLGYYHWLAFSCVFFNCHCSYCSVKKANEIIIITIWSPKYKTQWARPCNLQLSQTLQETIRMNL